VGVTEFSSALSLKVRVGELTAEQQGRVLAQWAEFRQATLILGIDALVFEQAALIANRHALGLRAGDALHLAVASAAGCTLVTLDNRMARAAPELGVPVAAI
jgi:predicted nucleic acid-binding protein